MLPTFSENHECVLGRREAISMTYARLLHVVLASAPASKCLAFLSYRKHGDER